MALRRLTRAYDRSFQQRPYATLAVANGSLKCFGDFCAQVIPAMEHEASQFQWDPARTLRFFVFGFCWGPVGGLWHEFLDALFPLDATPSHSSLHSALSDPLPSPKPRVSASFTSALPPQLGEKADSFPLCQEEPAAASHTTRRRRVIQVAKRVVLDQLILSPIFLFFFLSVMPLMEGQSVAEVLNRLRILYWHVLMAKWKVWPIIQCINFLFMPLPYRMPWQSACGILWTIFLSLTISDPMHASVAPSTRLTAPVMASAALEETLPLRTVQGAERLPAGLRGTAQRIAKAFGRQKAVVVGVERDGSAGVVLVPPFRQPEVPVPADPRA